MAAKNTVKRIKKVITIIKDDKAIVKDAENVSTPHHVFSTIPGLAKRFIAICQKEVTDWGWQGSSLKTNSWKTLKPMLNVEFGLNFDKKALKNRWDSQRRKYMAWRNVIGRSGGGMNHLTGEIDWPEHKWEERFPEAKTFKNNPLTNAQELYNLFEGTMACGDYAWSTGAENNDDNPIMVEDLPAHIDSMVTDLEEGNKNTYWSNVTLIDDDQTITPKCEQGSSSSRIDKKRKKSIDTSDPMVTNLLGMLNDQFSYIKSNNETARAEREAEKAAKAFEKAAKEAQMEACSLSECITVLNELREFGELPKGAYEKAMVKFVENPDYRKAFMQMVEMEHKIVFVVGLTSS
ncbi:hypothetical protein FRX31_008861 [Thalictrum thalictroides]|uniref:Myb/SANT-like domain-containing protein n=1 Tax=Thalictrum thalictroides TaxID=46969 RepID=A0A7J6WZL0_THATH|nr:hypothetical protein FRX31_008861 [Thalictrum thalictroides]